MKFCVEVRTTTSYITEQQIKACFLVGLSATVADKCCLVVYWVPGVCVDAMSNGTMQYFSNKSRLVSLLAYQLVADKCCA
jgi:hypothetical protein